MDLEPGSSQQTPVVPLSLSTSSEVTGAHVTTPSILFVSWNPSSDLLLCPTSVLALFVFCFLQNSRVLKHDFCPVFSYHELNASFSTNVLGTVNTQFACGTPLCGTLDIADLFWACLIYLRQSSNA